MIIETDQKKDEADQQNVEVIDLPLETNPITPTATGALQTLINTQKKDANLEVRQTENQIAHTRRKTIPTTHAIAALSKDT